jgi:hypothetical protein
MFWTGKVPVRSGKAAVRTYTPVESGRNEPFRSDSVRNEFRSLMALLFRQMVWGISAAHMVFREGRQDGTAVALFGLQETRFLQPERPFS